MQSSKYWRKVFSPPMWPSLPFTYAMSHTGIWTPFPPALWWLLKRSCDSLALLTTCVITLALVFSQQSVIRFIWTPLIHVADVILLPPFFLLWSYFGKTLLKVAKNFLRPEMPLSMFWRDTHRKRSQVDKHFSGFLCAHQNDTLDNLFLPVLTTTYFAVYRGRWPSLM